MTAGVALALCRATVLDRVLTQFAEQCHKGCREIVRLFCLAVSGLLFLGSLLARLAHWSDFLKADW
jgi:hypothetical protein